MKERRQHPRTPGRLKTTLDITRRILREHEAEQERRFWRETHQEWLDFVEEVEGRRPLRFSLSYTDMVFLHAIGALEWRCAGLLMFHRLIAEHGTKEEQERLEAMRVGFRRPIWESETPF